MVPKAVFNGKDIMSKQPTQYFSACCSRQMANVGGYRLLYPFKRHSLITRNVVPCMANILSLTFVCQFLKCLPERKERSIL